MASEYLFSYIVLFSILWSLMFLTKKSVLTFLISLEFLNYLLFLIYYCPLLAFWMSMSMFVLLLCFAVSGAAIGLSILVTLSRQSGNDLVVSFT
uniref:NADH dehydrogenase subunit 4L n=1 Tax=Dolicheulota formosensis TaxID=1632114 RepID=A0A0H3W551_DOLFO|nr:NADH dehydrogenase subunit 4L [Dolicheulota formosensis]AKJ85739.1 NADH dehydrogenase subunit 4L [Dolicheulota formosensis]